MIGLPEPDDGCDGDRICGAQGESRQQRRSRASRPDGERLGARLPRQLARENRRDDAGRQVPLVDLGDEARGVGLQSLSCAPRHALHAVHEGKVAGLCAADGAVRRASLSAAAWSASAESRKLVRPRSLGRTRWADRRALDPDEGYEYGLDALRTSQKLKGDAEPTIQEIKKASSEPPTRAQMPTIQEIK
jgi:hypothetical protein